MRVGLQISNYSWPGGNDELKSHLDGIARAVDKGGFTSLWPMDHFFQMDMMGNADEPVLEGYSVLNYLAAITRRVRLGTLVTAVTYRYPGVLVKAVTALDILSGGRGNFGIGAGWYRREARGLGVPYPPKKERFERLEETLQIAKHMWAGKKEPFTGKHYQLAEPVNSPQPLSKPHPPVLIAGGGEKKTLRLVAKYGDACNIHAFAGPEFVEHKFEVLKKHCEEVGRPYEEVERTTLSVVTIAPGEMSGEEVIATCRELAAAGVQHAIFTMRNAYEITPLEVFGEEIIPGVADF